jgi:hypothetical protein
LGRVGLGRMRACRCLGGAGSVGRPVFLTPVGRPGPTPARGGLRGSLSSSSEPALGPASLVSKHERKARAHCLAREWGAFYASPSQVERIEGPLDASNEGQRVVPNVGTTATNAKMSARVTVHDERGEARRSAKRFEPGTESRLHPSEQGWPTTGAPGAVNSL